MSVIFITRHMNIMVFLHTIITTDIFDHIFNNYLNNHIIIYNPLIFIRHMMHSHRIVCSLLGIPRRECLMVLSEFLFFLFFRRQGFRMITFDRQVGPLQNFNRSHVMVIGRSVSFSDPARPTGGGVGRLKHPKIPGTFLKKKLYGKKLLLRFKTPGRCFCENFSY